MKDVLTGIAMIAFVFIVLILGITQLYKGMNASACKTFARESNRETKVVYYGWGNYDCLTLQPNGQWVSAYSLRGE